LHGLLHFVTLIVRDQNGFELHLIALNLDEPFRIGTNCECIVVLTPVRELSHVVTQNDVVNLVMLVSGVNSIVKADVSVVFLGHLAVRRGNANRII